MLALYPMRGRDAKACAIRGTLSLALGIGRAIGARAARSSAIRSLRCSRILRGTEYYRHCRILFEGKIVDLRARRSAAGPSARSSSKTLRRARASRRSSSGTNTCARRSDGRTVAIVPDLIAMLDRETAEPITTEDLKYGQRVKVVGASVPPIMRSERALEVWGPKAFGYDEPLDPSNPRETDDAYLEIPSPDSGAIVAAFGDARRGDRARAHGRAASRRRRKPRSRRSS